MIYVKQSEKVEEVVVVEETEDWAQFTKMMIVLSACLAVFVVMLLAMIFVMKNRMN